jgi:hypothetical protein
MIHLCHTISPPWNGRKFNVPLIFIIVSRLDDLRNIFVRLLGFREDSWHKLLQFAKIS